MKEQDKSPEEQLGEVKIDNLLEKEFRIMIVKMIQDLRKRMEARIEKMQKMFTMRPRLILHGSALVLVYVNVTTDNASVAVTCECHYRQCSCVQCNCSRL